MWYSLLRISDFSLDTGLEGLLMYVNLHLYNNRNKAIFENSYQTELQTALKSLPANASDNMKVQASLFARLTNGEECAPDVSALQFIKGFRENDITLQYGLAGKLLGA